MRLSQCRGTLAGLRFFKRESRSLITRQKTLKRMKQSSSLRSPTGCFVRDATSQQSRPQYGTIDLQATAVDPAELPDKKPKAACGLILLFCLLLSLVVALNFFFKHDIPPSQDFCMNPPPPRFIYCTPFLFIVTLFLYRSSSHSINSFMQIRCCIICKV